VYRVKDQASHPYKTLGKIIILLILLQRDIWNTKISKLNGREHFLNFTSFSFQQKYNFDFLLLFQNILSLPHLEWISIVIVIQIPIIGQKYCENLKKKCDLWMTENWEHGNVTTHATYSENHKCKSFYSTYL